jgi:sulfopyruvate decarboxylase subunit alpha
VREISTDVTTGATGADLIYDQLKSCGISLGAGLPDDWLVPLMARIDEDPEFTLVRVAREPEAVGVCGGALLGGAQACAFMGIAGTLEDPRTYQVAQGISGLPYLDALGIPYMTIEKLDDVPLIPAAYRRSRLVKRPFVCFFTKAVLMHGVTDYIGE